MAVQQEEQKGLGVLKGFFLLTPSITHTRHMGSACGAWVHVVCRVHGCACACGVQSACGVHVVCRVHGCVRDG